MAPRSCHQTDHDANHGPGMCRKRYQRQIWRSIINDETKRIIYWAMAVNEQATSAANRAIVDRNKSLRVLERVEH